MRERYFRPRGALLGVRAGRFRMPFGIYTRSDYGYSGFLRPPLIRYDGYFGISNNWLEDGAMFTAGVPQLFVEASVSRPHDVGFAVTARRARTRPSACRAIADSSSSAPVTRAAIRICRRDSPSAGRRSPASTCDGRTPPGIQARGEFLKGHSYEGVSTIGGYTSTASSIARAWDRLPRSYAASGSTTPRRRRAPAQAKRLTLGTRVRLPGPVTLQLNYLRQHGDLPHIKTHSIDFSATYSLRLDRYDVTSIRNEIRWHDRMEARVAAGILLLVALSVAAVVFTATRVATRSAVARAVGQPRRRAIGVLPARRRSRGVRGAADTAHHRAARLPLDDDQSRSSPATSPRSPRWPRATGRPSTRSSPSCRRRTARPTATPGWPQGVALPAALASGHPWRRGRTNRGATSCRSTASCSSSRRSPRGSPKPRCSAP